jgi:Flp pilus assembly secretin CpaC
LGYIPVIGLLFQDIIKSEETTELVIYITPYLHSVDGAQTDIHRNIESYYRKYVSDSIGASDE